MSNIVIVEDVPNYEALRFIIEEMSKDKWVGPIWGQTKEQYIAKMKDYIQYRYESDITSTVAYEGSSIVGIAFNKRMDSIQSECANIKEINDYWKMGNFFILQHHRGKGLGKKALRFYLDAKKNKVFYFAEFANEISNHIAKSVGMIHTHDFAFTAQNKIIHLQSPDHRIRQKDVVYYHVYVGEVPNPSLILPNKVGIYK